MNFDNPLDYFSKESLDDIREVLFRISDLQDSMKEEKDEKKTSKKEEFILNLEDFVELMSSLCPEHEELIKHQGEELVKQAKNLM